MKIRNALSLMGALVFAGSIAAAQGTKSQSKAKAAATDTAKKDTTKMGKMDSKMGKMDSKSGKMDSKGTKMDSKGTKMDGKGKKGAKADSTKPATKKPGV